MNWPPSRISRKRASSSGISGAYCALTSISGIGGTASTNCSPAVDEIRRGSDDACNHEVFHVLEAVVEAVVARPECIADAGNGEGPDGGADGRQRGVRAERHLERARRDGDERTDDGRDAADEHADVAPA